jgi:hypothetical protein
VTRSIAWIAGEVVVRGGQAAGDENVLMQVDGQVVRDQDLGG